MVVFEVDGVWTASSLSEPGQRAAVTARGEAVTNEHRALVRGSQLLDYRAWAFGSSALLPNTVHQRS